VGVGSIVQDQGGLALVIPFGTPAPMSNTLPTGRGYADHGYQKLLPAEVHLTHMEMTVIRPIIGAQKLITMLGAKVGNATLGVAHTWGFALTTKTVLVRNTGTLQGNPHNTTITAKGYDCVNAKGKNCSVPTGMNNRNISLVAGALGEGILPPPIGTVPIVNFVSTWLPEPDGTLQLVAGAIGLLAIAAWRGRRGQ
jgi:hypothetical protein